MAFLKSAPNTDDLPESPAEVAFAGRSNVGKSSLINALANQKRLAETSKTPGRTRLLNIFELDLPGQPSGRPANKPRPTVVDLPGYGYAKVPAHMRAKWGPMIEEYLLERECLRCILVLVDGEIGPTESDVSMLDWVEHNELPFQIVATKHDKVKSAKRQKRKRELAEACGVDQKEVLWVSAAKGVNIDVLRSRILSWLDSPG
jgi:GTP-binding protein